jgi:mannonate dehydratase
MGRDTEARWHSDQAVSAEVVVSQTKSAKSGQIGRRELLKLPAMAAASGLLPRSAMALPIKGGAPMDEADPEGTKIAIKLTVQHTTGEELFFLKQIGLRWLHADFGEEASYDVIKTTQERFARYGLKIDCALMEKYRSKRIQLGQPGRDEDIEKFNTFLTDCGRLGIRTSHIDFHPGNTYTTNMITTARGYVAREFSVTDFREKVEKRMFDRDYSAEEIWANYGYFLDAVLPVAEKAGIKLAHHPDDPPISPMNGVAKVFLNYAGYKHAEDVVAKGSKNWGLCLCLGTWLEGGDTMGKDAASMIREFGRRDKLFTIHFRNVSSPLPRFHETFQDDGYQDMYLLMKALREVRSTASLIPDHYPGIVSDNNLRIDNAYMVSAMRQMLRRAYEEVG